VLALLTFETLYLENSSFKSSEYIGHTLEADQKKQPNSTVKFLAKTKTKKSTFLGRKQKIKEKR